MIQRILHSSLVSNLVINDHPIVHFMTNSNKASLLAHFTACASFKHTHVIFYSMFTAWTCTNYNGVLLCDTFNGGVLLFYRIMMLKSFKSKFWPKVMCSSTIKDYFHRAGYI